MFNLNIKGKLFIVPS